jgi:HSP20 family protein
MDGSAHKITHVSLKNAQPNQSLVRTSGPENAEHWAVRHEEGQLSVDVLDVANDIVIIAALAGTKSDDISLHLQDDLLTIRGARNFPLEGSHAAFYRECYWGPFSRTIVLPVSVRQESARAEYRNGILMIWLEKNRSQSHIPLVVVEE